MNTVSTIQGSRQDHAGARLTIYIAASHRELDRIKDFAAALEQLGASVPCKWWEHTRPGTPHTKDWRRDIANELLDAIGAADIFVWLSPAEGHGYGSAMETALAIFARMTSDRTNPNVITVGETASHVVFGALVDAELSTDVEALAFIIKNHVRPQLLRVNL